LENSRKICQMLFLYPVLIHALSLLILKRFS
jgi:hypothetical protein